MTKSRLAARVAFQTSISRAGAFGTVNAMISATTDGETVSIPGLRTSSTKSCPAGQGRNRRPNESIATAASLSHSFLPGKYATS